MSGDSPKHVDPTNTGNLWFHCMACAIWLGAAIVGFAIDAPSIVPCAFLILSGWFGLNLAIGLGKRTRRQ